MDNTVNVEGKVEDPREGMLLDTIDEVKECYRRYGNECGFHVVTRSCTNGDDGEKTYVVFGCSYSGKSRCNSRNVRKRLPSTKSDCKAKLSASKCPDGKWKVTRFIDDHNHALSPGDLRPLRRKLKKNDRAGISVNKIFNPAVIKTGGHENVPFFEKDFRNHTDTVTRLRLGQGDAGAIQNFFMKMQANNSNFFYTMDLDDEGRLRNVFWADARSRRAYEEFGDAITFDTRYLTNKYDMPFVSFTGVNQHGQLILLGCGLLSGEDTETFTWLFQALLACMAGCAPKAIITDHDKAMHKAIEIVFCNTRYRWCLSHIMKKLPEKLGGYNQYEEINFLLQNVVNHSLSPDEFEVRWNRMIEKYNLQRNEWLLDLWSERHRWVPAFLKDTFWAEMSTTQDSAFFHGYVNSKTTLKQFLEQYENAMQSKVKKENRDDLNSLNSQVPCITHYAMEKQFQDAYTTTKFKEFQHELTGKICCDMSSIKKDVTMSEYEISEDLKVGEIDRRASFKVSLTHDDCGIQCSCCLFETKGILCRHTIIVLIHNKILSVPEKYIIRRWRKDLTRRHTKVKISYADCSGKPEGCQFDKMCNALREVADLSADSKDKMEMVMDWINDLKNKLKRDDVICRTSQPTIPPNDGASGVLPVSPPFKRKHSKGEQRMSESKRKNTTDDNTMQEGNEGPNVDGGSDTMDSANANLVIWGVPQSGRPSIPGGGQFAPPRLAYGPGYVMNNTVHPIFPHRAIASPTDFASFSARQGESSGELFPSTPSKGLALPLINYGY